MKEFKARQHREMLNFMQQTCDAIVNSDTVVAMDAIQFGFLQLKHTRIQSLQFRGRL